MAIGDSGLGRAVLELSTSDTKLEQELEALKKRLAEVSSAFVDIGGASKLSHAEQARLNQAVTEAIGKYQTLGQKAPADLLRLAQATKQAEAPMSGLQRAAGALSGTFAQFTAAGVASALIQKAGAALGEFIQTSTKLPAMETSFGRLAAAAGQSADVMLSKLKTATRGLVAEYDLMASSNKAMLLGLPVTAQSMSELAKTATTLGKAMGQDATKSLDDLITALGRSSPMILDNLGLTVKVGEANEAYAAKLGKTAEQLTDAEKKMAFYEAAMEAARKKQAELGEQADTLSEILSRLWISVGDTASSFIAEMNVGIGQQIQALRDLIPRWHENASATGESAAATGEEKEETVSFTNALIAGLPFVGRWIANTREQAAMAREAASNQEALNAATHRFNELAAKRPKFGAAEGPGSLNLGRLADDYRTVQQAADDFYNNTQRRQREAGQAAAEEVARLERDHEQAFATIAKATKQGAEDWIRFEQSLSATVDRARADLERGFGGGRDPLDKKRLVPLINDTNFLEVMGAGSMTERSAQAVKDFAQMWKDHTLTVAAPIMSKGWTDALGAMLSDSARVFGTGGGLFASVKQFTDTFAKDFTKGMLSFIPGIGPMISQFAGPLVDGIKKLFGGLFKGNDTRKMFQDTFGDLDTFHAKLLTLGDAGEQFWIRMTQRTGKGDTAGATALIDEITAALDRQKVKEEETAAASVKAEEEKIAGRQKAADVAKDQLKILDDQIKSLQDSIANEAPEEFMGVVETQTRARIAALEKERAAAAENVKRTEETLAESMDRVAEAIEKIPTDIEIQIRTKYEGGGIAPPVPMAGGGFGRVTRPTLFYSRGQEDFAFSGEGRSFGAGAGLRNAVQHITFKIGERTAARAMLRGYQREAVIVGV